MDRPDWDSIWMDFAKNISRRSIDPKHKVGAVIVTEDNTQVLSLGYNGDHKGGPNVRDSLRHGHSGLIHAEINALIKCDYNNPKSKKITQIVISNTNEEITINLRKSIILCCGGLGNIPIYNHFIKGWLVVYIFINRIRNFIKMQPHT